MSDTKSHDEIVMQVKEIVAEVLKKTPAEINEDDDFEHIGLDSLDRMTLVITLEDAIQISVPDEEAKTLKTVSDVVRFIESKQVS